MREMGWARGIVWLHGSYAVCKIGCQSGLRRSDFRNPVIPELDAQDWDACRY